MNEFPGYETSHEEVMRLYFHSLPEDHRRRYAAVEAQKIGYGGFTYIARLFGMSRRTIYAGQQELDRMSDDDPDHPQRPSGHQDYIRRAGAGRPKAIQSRSGLKQALEEVLEAHTAGSPTDTQVQWTDLKPMRLANALSQRGYAVARNTADKLLDQAGFRRRRLRKELITGEVDPYERDRQFCHIATLRHKAHAQGNPMLSVDTKKKEAIGTLHREGECYSTNDQKVYDHDFKHLSKGKLVPQGVYDAFSNVGYMTLGTSCENSAFVCDAIELAWEAQYRALYPNATELVLTMDCGGANSARSLRFKEDLIQLSKRLELPIRVAHYPPYTSKWNPIEHRLFSQIERSFRGIMLDSYETALKAVQRTQTCTGLRVFGQILDKVYETGRKCSDQFRDIKDRYIQHDTILGKWNYVVDGRGIF